MFKKLLLAAAILAVLGFAGMRAYREAMVRGWIRYNEYDIRTEGQLRVGDLAPDLELAQVGAEGKILLSELYREKPVVLAFGSYT